MTVPLPPARRRFYDDQPIPRPGAAHRHPRLREHRPAVRARRRAERRGARRRRRQPQCGHRGGLCPSRASRATTAATRRCWRTPRSTPSTCRCPTACTPNGRSARSSAASTSCAKSRWRWAVPRHRPCSTPRDAAASCCSSRFPYRFQPQTGDLLALLDGGVIGAVRSVQACFGFTLANPQGNIRMQPELGGGALLDAGSYPLSFIRLVMGCAPQTVRADATWADTGVDVSTDGDAVLRRRPPCAALLRDGRRQPSPRHDRGQRRARSRPST